MNDSSSRQSPRRWLLITAAGVLALFLCLCTGLAGFAFGRTNGAPQAVTETITELIEVTREIEIQVTVEVEPPANLQLSQDDDADTPAQPTAAPTATPPPIDFTEVDPETLDLNVFYEVWQVIGSEFDGDLPSERELLYSTINGSLATLDDEFTRFIRPEVAARLREDMGGAVEGIGAFVRENDEGMFEIVRPIDGQPAHQAGIQGGDIIIAVDGESVLGVSFDEVILMVRGPRGTSVNLTIMRPDVEEPLEFNIVRARFEIPIIEAEMLGDPDAPVAYVRLTEFNRNAHERLVQALTELLAQNPRGLVFDLRDNPGGFLDQSVAVADIFLPQSVVLYERNRRGLDQTFQAEDGDIGEEIPLVVLVNAGSASAAEIVAGAIQDNGRAIIIGERTFGKGSVQQVHTLSDGSELRVTIARWYTPDNNTIDSEGITPDIEVETPDTLRGEDDGQLQRAIEYILTGE